MSRFTAYRLLTGADDAAFCHRVTRALSQGWLLYGGPAYAYDAASGTMRCAQAVTKEIEGAYDPDAALDAL